MKILFVTHDISIYGASKSLQSLLRPYKKDGVSFDLLINKKIRGRNDLGSVRKTFGSNVNNIFEQYLPLDFCWQGAEPLPFIMKVKNFISRLFRYRVHRLIRENAYDIIHLNSLVLNPLISDDFRFVIHIREIFDGKSPSAVRRIDKAKGVIFIDDATFNSLPKRQRSNWVILNNPFDMSSIAGAPDPALPFNAKGKAIVAMIGRMTKAKGTDFVIHSFLNAGLRGTILVIVGNGDEAFVKECNRIAGGSEAVHFYGEEPTIERIYKVADYVIRGEDTPCIGRTVYEGLYSGCEVILPGIESMAIEPDFADRVHYYAPRSMKDLSVLLQRFDGKKVEKKSLVSNTEEYAANFHKFLTGLIEGVK
jgi:glycosyltransferase involved in cell wall biosynthesis